MAITKDRKQELLAKAQSIFGESNSAVFVHAQGMLGNDTSAMRSELKGEGVGYAVIKKTLINKALDEVTLSGVKPDMEGELAVAYGADLIDPARLVRMYEKKFKGHIEIMGGIFDGAYMDKAQMTEIADIPAVPVLRGMFVNIINTPIQQMAVALSAIAEQKEASA